MADENKPVPVSLEYGRNILKPKLIFYVAFDGSRPKSVRVVADDDGKQWAAPEAWQSGNSGEPD